MSLGKKSSAIIAQRYARFRKLRSTIKEKKSKVVCGIAYRPLNVDYELCEVYIDKNFNLVNRENTPNISLKFRIIDKKSKTDRLRFCIHIDESPPKSVIIKRK